eukprot:2777411-Amphidinium_carterae.1
MRHDGKWWFHRLPGDCRKQGTPEHDAAQLAQGPADEAKQLLITMKQERESIGDGGGRPDSPAVHSGGCRGGPPLEGA